MKFALTPFILMLLVLGLAACQPSQNHNGKSPSEKPLNSGWCNSRQRCFSENELLHLKQMTHIRYGYTIAPMQNLELEENDVIRLKAIGLNEAYETLFDASLVDETNEFLSKLYNFVYEKE